MQPWNEAELLSVRTESDSTPRARLPWLPNTFFAPMEGVTHPPLRELMAARGGVGVVCTEFVRVTAQPLGKKALAKHVVRPSQGALSVQVMGKDIEQMAEATRLVSDAGADIVDINLGCPAPRVVRKGVGSAMLKDRRLLAAVVSAMRAATTLPLSAKIRAGFDDSDGVLEIARIVQDSGVDFITVHPRRRADFYQGVADWRIVALLSSELRVPVVGNGDVWYARDALRLEKETGCAAIMMGRPALRNPWIFRQLADLRAGQRPEHPDGKDVVDYVQQLNRLLETHFASRNRLGLLKEQVRYLLRATDPALELAREALRTTTLDELLSFMDRKLATLDKSELDLQAESGRFECHPSALQQQQSSSA